jgi:hypothetical protein
MMYCPQSPGRELVYRPESPGLFRQPLTRVDKILSSYRNLKNFKLNMNNKPFRHFNYMDYADTITKNKLSIANTIRMNGSDPTDFLERSLTKIEIMRDFNKQNQQPLPVPLPDPLHDIPYESDYVKLHVKVGKNGKVKITTDMPIERLYEFYRNGEIPPIKDHLKALQTFGYPKEYLEKVYNHHLEMDKATESRQEFIETVFGKGKGKAKK